MRVWSPGVWLSTVETEKDVGQKGDTPAADFVFSLRHRIREVSSCSRSVCLQGPLVLIRQVMNHSKLGQRLCFQAVPENRYKVTSKHIKIPYNLKA
jgi:hypothetical protein